MIFNFLSSVIDNLTSTNKALPLSANQGRVLKGEVDAVKTQLGKIEHIYLENTLGETAYGKPWLEMEAQASKLKAGVTYVGYVKCATHWEFFGKMADSEYGSFICHSYSDTKNLYEEVYHVTCYLGKWSYEKLNNQRDITNLQTSLNWLSGNLGQIKYITLTATDQSTKDHIGYIKSVWETLNTDTVYIARVHSQTVKICLIQKYGSHLYGSILAFGYGEEGIIFTRLNNGVWEDEYNPITADRTTIRYAADTKEEALAYLNNPTTIDFIGKKYACYNFLFSDAVGDSPFTGGVTEVLGYTYSDNKHGCQIALKYDAAPKWRNLINGTWSEWKRFANHADVTALQTKATSHDSSIAALQTKDTSHDTSIANIKNAFTLSSGTLTINLDKLKG